jgi:MYXO-CTERM domain-containing protein
MTTSRNFMAFALAASLFLGGTGTGFAQSASNQQNGGTAAQTTATNDTGNRENNHHNWGWLGLIGLVGLAGLMRRTPQREYGSRSPRMGSNPAE